MAIPVAYQSFKAAGIYRLIYDKSTIPNTATTNTIRLIVGYSDKGPFNTPVLVSNQSEFVSLFGNGSKALEKRGVFFHRLAKQCLSTYPCLCLNLKKFANEHVGAVAIDTKLNEKDVIKSLKYLVSDIYDTTRFWTLDATKLSEINPVTIKTDGSYVYRKNAENKECYINIATTSTVNDSYSIFIRKASGTHVSGFNITVSDWYNDSSDEIPEYLQDKLESQMSDFMAEVYVFSGKFTKSQIIASETLGTYFDVTTDDSGNDTITLKPYLTNAYNEKIDTLQALYEDSTSGAMGRYIGSLIPYFKDKMGAYVDLSILFNQDVDTHHLMMDFNKDLLDAEEPVNIDLSGSNSSKTVMELFKAGKSSILGNVDSPVNIVTYSETADETSEDGSMKIVTTDSYEDAVYDGSVSVIPTLSKPLKISDDTSKYNGFAYMSITETLGNALEAGDILVPKNYAKDDSFVHVIDICSYEDAVSKYSIKDATEGSSYVITDTEPYSYTTSTTTTDYDKSSNEWNTYTTYAYKNKLLTYISSTLNYASDENPKETTSYAAYEKVYQSIATYYPTATTDEILSMSCDLQVDSYFDIDSEGKLFNQSTWLGQLYTCYNENHFETWKDMITYTETASIFYNFVDLYVTIPGVNPYSGGEQASEELQNAYAQYLEHVVGPLFEYADLAKATYQQIKDQISEYNSDIATAKSAGENVSELAEANETDVQAIYTSRADFSDNIVAEKLDAVSHITVTTETPNLIRVENSFNQEIGKLSPIYFEGYVYEHSRPESTSMKDKLSWQNFQLSAINDYKGIHTALLNKSEVDYRYVVDTFETFIDSEVKSTLSYLCKEKQSAFLITNFPSIKSFLNCPYNDYTDENGNFNVQYIVDGYNKKKAHTTKFSLPTDANGASFAAFYTCLKTGDGYVSSIIPSAGVVSNMFMTKYSTRHPYDIVAGPNYGLVVTSDLDGPDYNYSKEELNIIEPFGVNCIVYRPGFGTFINANKTAKQTPVSALSSINVRELCIYIQDEIESILQGYQWEFNNASLRTKIKDKADALCQAIQNNGGLNAYENVCDETNNTDDIIDNEMVVLSTSIEPGRGAGKMVQELTIYRTGGLTSSTSE
jgi:hypothetical protein